MRVDTRVQDAYSLRCAPQVTGAVRDTLAHARAVADHELASAIDNPVVLDDGQVRSNGNFHGAPLAYVLDFLAIVVADLASISERRTDRLLDPARSHGLPAFLAEDPGVDSGLMLAHYAQASLVSQCKRLAVPASVDSLPTLGHAGGPRVDGLGRGPEAAGRPRPPRRRPGCRARGGGEGHRAASSAEPGAGHRGRRGPIAPIRPGPARPFRVPRTGPGQPVRALRST